VAAFIIRQLMSILHIPLLELNVHLHEELEVPINYLAISFEFLYKSQILMRVILRLFRNASRRLSASSSKPLHSKSRLFLTKDRASILSPLSSRVCFHPLEVWPRQRATKSVL
jgi:hypothetical protein